MALPKYTPINTKDYELGRVQNQIGSALDLISITPVLGGNLLTQISLVTGSNTISHKLGRNLIGWQIVRQRSLASIYDNQDNNKTPSLNLILNSSAPVVVDLYVF